jgi:hypothetical protein
MRIPRAVMLVGLMVAASMSNHARAGIPEVASDGVPRRGEVVAVAADPGGATRAVVASDAAPAAGTGGYRFPTPRDRFRAWASSALGPPAIAGNLVGASWRHWVTDEPEEWDGDGRGFARRFGSGSLATLVSETSLALASAAMRQDPGYYRCPRSGVGARVRHAVTMTFVARDFDGDMVFSPGKTLSPFLGPVATVTTVYPERHSVADALGSGAYGLLITAGWNAVREFLLPSPRWGGGRVTSRVP